MAKNTDFVSHKKSKLKENGGPKLPLATDLVEGEIAINFGKDVETLSIKNESGDVVTFSSDNYYTEKKLGSGFTGANSAVTVTDVIEENEEIIAAALTDIDERKLDASAYTELWEASTGENSVVLKNSNNVASGISSVAEGSGTTAGGNYSHAEGQSTKAIGGQSHAEGYNTTASGYYSHTEGNNTVASGNSSHAEGQSTSATSYASHAEGSSTIASGNYSHAEGSSTSATSLYSHAEGYDTLASGRNSHAEGQSTSATSISSHAEGYLTKASGDYSHAEGQNTTASGGRSHAEGYYTTASGFYSHAEGASTSATSLYSHAEGYSTLASSYYSHAEGQSTSATSISSHAEGYGTLASGNSSHAEGYYTTASGVYSHAEGQRTIASGESSHAEGVNTLASGKYSHAEGSSTIANNQSEHASGQYNVSHSATTTFGDSGNTLFSVGNGNYNTPRHNAFEIMQNGDIYIVDNNGNDIKLQDNLGGGGSITVDQVLDDTTSASTNPVSSKAVYKAVTDNELVWTNAFVELSSITSAHTANTEIHVTAADKASWDNAATNSHTHNNKATLDTITGNVGTMAYENKASYYTKSETSGKTEISTALGNKSNTGHNHTSNEIIAMTNYTSGSTNTPIQTNDTLNQAIGKLEHSLGGINLIALTQQQYDDLATKNPTTLYIITDN